MKATEQLGVAETITEGLSTTKGWYASKQDPKNVADALYRGLTTMQLTHANNMAEALIIIGK
jgi:hypothetical protein